MTTALHILHVDDSVFDRQLVRDALEHENDQFVVTSAASREEYEAQLTGGNFDLVMTDFNILGFEGLQVIDDVHEKYPTVPVIVVTGTGSEEVAVEAMKRGAVDYVIKTAQHIRRLPLAVHAAMEMTRLRNEQIRSEAVLRASEERLRAFANALPDLAFIIDEDGRLLQLLSTPEHLLFATGERQQGKLVHEVLPETVAYQILSAIHQAVETRTTQSVEYQLDLPTGRVWFEARLSLMVNVSSEKALVVYVARNITDRKEAELALKVSQDILEKRNRVLTALYEIGHALSATLNTEEIYKTIYQEFAQRLFGAPNFRVSLYDETTRLLSSRFAIKDNTTVTLGQNSWSPLAESPDSEAIRTRKARVVNMAEIYDQQLPSANDLGDAPSPAVALYAPLISGDHVIGVMSVESYESAAFHEVDLVLVETIANQCAVALANANLYEQAQQEIRERRQTETRLARERNLLRTLIDNVPDYIFVSDREGRFIASNTAHAAIANLSPAQLIGKTSLEIFSPTVDQSLHHDDEKVMVACESLVNEERLMVDADDNQRWILATKVPLCNENGDVIGLVGISRDISQRKQAEEALRASEEHLRAVISGNPVIFFALDKKGVVILLQGKGFEKVGLNLDVYIGKSIFEVYEEIFPDIRERFQLVLGGEESEVVYTLSNTIFSVHYSPLRNKTGEVYEVIGVATDITERLKMERLQIELEKEQEIIALKERFLASASHDFRTPLTIIKMSANALEAYFDRISPEQRTAKLRLMSTQVDRMIQLLEDILTMSKANAGKLEFKPEPVKLRSFCEQIWDNFLHIAEKTHSLEFTYNVVDDEVLLDPDLVNDILANLLSNAIKYSPKGGQIEFFVGVEGQYILFKISDNGIGIPEKDLAKLFQPFHRAENTRGIDGTGLGLSIVKSYVDVHGGRISVQSKEGQGTTFFVYIPAIHGN